MDSALRLIFLVLAVFVALWLVSQMGIGLVIKVVVAIGKGLAGLIPGIVGTGR